LALNPVHAEQQTAKYLLFLVRQVMVVADKQHTVNCPVTEHQDETKIVWMSEKIQMI
jgi:hypothetical protein